MPKPQGRREASNWDWGSHKFLRRQTNRGKRYDGRDGIRLFLRGLHRRASQHYASLG